jgi:antitoxin VapB
VIKTTLFLSNKTQAVRLPKDVAFPDHVKEVCIIKEGNRLVIVPAGSVWDDFFDQPGVDIEAPPELPYEEREPF